MDYMSMFMGAADGVTAFLKVLMFLVLGIGIIILLAMWIFYIKSFKHKIRVRIVASDRKYIKDDKFRIVRDSDGVIWWHLAKMKHKIPVAPSEAIEISEGGLMCVEAYFTQEGEYVYASDTIDKKSLNETSGAIYIANKFEKIKILEQLTEKLKEYNALPFLKKLITKKPKYKDVKVNGRYLYIKDKNKSIDAFQPLTTKQRLILVNQYKKAYARKKKGFSDILQQAVPIVGVIIILVICFMFWDDITKPSLEAQKTMASIAEKQAETQRLLNEIILEKQTVGGGTRAQIDEPPS